MRLTIFTPFLAVPNFGPLRMVGMLPCYDLTRLNRFEARQASRHEVQKGRAAGWISNGKL